MAPCHRKLFSELKTDVSAILERLQVETPQQEHVQATWKQDMVTCCRNLSHHGNKLALACQSLPWPNEEDTNALCKLFESGMVQLLSVYLNRSSPQGCGSHYHEAIHRFSCEVGEASVLFVESLLASIGKKKEHMSSLILQGIGKVWEKCDEASLLPKNNVEAVLTKIKSDRRLLEDALDELNSAVEDAKSAEQGDFDQLDEVWSENELILVSYGNGLLKAVQAVCKKNYLCIKSSGNATTESNISELDETAKLIAQIIPLVDEFASSLYPPLISTDLIKNAEELQLLALQLLNFVKEVHFVPGDQYQQWGAFLTKAVDHNWNKIREKAVEISLDDVQIKEKN